ncbi:hypothetical protein GALL_375540 [mine drainage metagenome]|uniref:Uncharacterized protein n=1 Tax=mine drainage metagenome TaxID=410659 RepID=A0A1J5QAM9_9ZZZZ
MQIVYERNLRSAEKQHAPWIERVTSQLLAAYDGLEAACSRRPLAASGDAINQAGVSAAVAWRFTQRMIPGVVDAANDPLLRAFSAQAERWPAFAPAPARIRTQAERGPQPRPMP